MVESNKDNAAVLRWPTLAVLVRPLLWTSCGRALRTSGQPKTRCWPPTPTAAPKPQLADPAVRIPSGLGVSRQIGSKGADTRHREGMQIFGDEETRQPDEARCGLLPVFAVLQSDCSNQQDGTVAAEAAAGRRLCPTGCGPLTRACRAS